MCRSERTNRRREEDAPAVDDDGLRVCDREKQGVPGIRKSLDVASKWEAESVRE